LRTKFYVKKNPISVLQNFSEEAYSALLLNGIIIGMYPLSVSPSRTAICPINPRFLPQVRIRTNNKSFGKLRFPPNKDVENA